jgi:hypothetical protein
LRRIAPPVVLVSYSTVESLGDEAVNQNSQLDVDELEVLRQRLLNAAHMDLRGGYAIRT